MFNKSILLLLIFSQTLLSVDEEPVKEAGKPVAASHKGPPGGPAIHEEEEAQPSLSNVLLNQGLRELIAFLNAHPPKYIEKIMFKPDETGKSPWFNAKKHMQPLLLKQRASGQILVAQPHKNESLWVDEAGYNELHYAAINQVNVLISLLNRLSPDEVKILMSQKSKTGRTPLDLASKNFANLIMLRASGNIVSAPKPVQAELDLKLDLPKDQRIRHLVSLGELAEVRKIFDSLTAPEATQYLQQITFLGGRDRTILHWAARQPSGGEFLRYIAKKIGKEPFLKLMRERASNGATPLPGSWGFYADDYQMVETTLNVLEYFDEAVVGELLQIRSGDGYGGEGSTLYEFLKLSHAAKDPKFVKARELKRILEVYGK